MVGATSDDANPLDSAHDERSTNKRRHSPLTSTLYLVTGTFLKGEMIRFVLET
jgi:hypothetical protein